MLVQFTVQNGVPLGERTTASAKVLTPLGQEYLDLEPAGRGQMAAGAVIPQSRTHETQTIVSTVRAGANVVQGINLQQLVQAMAVTNQDLEAVPPGATSSLLKGLSQLSDVIASRSGELAQLVQNVSQLTATLHQHGTQLFSLIGQSDLVLQVLNQRHAAIDQLLKSTAVLTQQLDALLSAHQAQVGPLLSDLETVSGVLAKDGNEIEAAIPLLTSANKYLANVTGSGAFGDFVMPAALIPDNVIAQCSKPGADQRRYGVQSVTVNRSRLILAVMAAAAVVVAVGALVGIRAALSTPTYRVTADFPEAPGVYVGNHVDVLGIPVGICDSRHAAPDLCVRRDAGQFRRQGPGSCDRRVDGARHCQ